MPVTHKTQEEIPKETFVPFTAARKAMIAATKVLITDPKHREIVRNCYGNRIRSIFFKDYLAYAVMRGKDFRSASHEAGYDRAVTELRGVASDLDNYLKDQDGYYAKFAKRHLPAEQSVEAATELRDLIRAALAAPGA